MSLSSLPHSLWHLYIDTLVNYKPESWVHSIASTFRLLALAAIVPFILLTLLDVASYLIARTLGVIDETKASTSGGADAVPGTALPSLQPTIVVHADEGGDSKGTTRPAASPPSGDEDDTLSLKLSGVDIISPVPSQPGSPTLQRRGLMQHQYQPYGSSVGGDSVGASAAGGGAGHAEDGGRDGARNTFTRDPSVQKHTHTSSNSSSGEESYAVVDLDQDIGSDTEDAGTLMLRRRTRATGTGTGAGDEDVTVGSTFPAQ